MSDAAGSPKTRGIADLEERIARLNRYKAWGALVPVPMEDLAGSDLWDQHWKNLADIETRMRQAQTHAEILKAAIQESLQRS